MCENYFVILYFWEVGTGVGEIIRDVRFGPKSDIPGNNVLLGSQAILYTKVTVRIVLY